jgi:hypothetical protein
MMLMLTLMCACGAITRLQVVGLLRRTLAALLLMCS